jgi:ubiquitin C-terminal hydrolase
MLGLMLTFKESRDVADLMKTAKASRVDALKLGTCLDAFSAGEQLSNMDTWYCPKCKDTVQAFKKMDLWSVPPVLVLHLKRFQSDDGYKIETPVQFDEFLDMSPHVLGPQKDKPLKYELFSVSNHVGFLIDGGHCTAYAKVADKWALYNDSSVSECTIDSVCTDEAYVLFYRRMSDEA